MEEASGHWEEVRIQQHQARAPEDIITYKFAANINDKKAREKFIKGPLKLKLVLETIELDNYNRKFGDKYAKFKRQRKTSSDTSSKDEQIEQIGYTKHMPRKRTAITNEKKNAGPQLTLLWKAKLDTGQDLPGTESPMQQLQKDVTFCESMPIKDRESDTRRRHRKQYGAMARNRSYTIRQRDYSH